ncbi:hypothetical protein [Xenorhabdus miraniensis]|uniref:hypothetical protein n=1 Tax=Xenorhabdus miraniensis TaxID=351674 RepID=UPI0011AB350F|nr:hypothetical protein [Xenorhabdus miraniensis]
MEVKYDVTEKTFSPDGKIFSRRMSGAYVADVLIKNKKTFIALNRQYLLPKVCRCTALKRSLAGYGSLAATRRRSLQAHRSSGNRLIFQTSRQRVNQQSDLHAF